MSWQMRAVALYTRAVRRRVYASPRGARTLLTRPKGPSAPPAKAVADLALRREEVAGFRVYAAHRPGTGTSPRPVVIYCHGGAYVSEIAPQHWQLAAQIARDLDVEVWVPIYGLAPQHHAAEARTLMAALLGRLREEGRPVYLAGDSAGGGLALAAAQHDVATPGSALAGLTLIAPWLDLTMANPEIDALERVDPWLARPALHEVARVWAGGIPLDDPSVSPIHGELAGLPPVLLTVGTHDITLADARLLAARLADAGVEVAYDEVDGGIHVVPLLPVPEAAAARALIHDHIRRCLP